MKNKLSILLIGLLCSGCETKKPLEGLRESVVALKQKSASLKNGEGVALDGSSNILSDDLKLLQELDLGNTNTSKLLSLPIMVGNEIVILDTSHMLRGFDRNTLKEMWAISLVDHAREDQEGAIGGGGVAFSDDMLYVTSALGEVIAISAADKKIIWRKKTSGFSRGAPLVDEKAVYVLSNNNRSAAYDKKTGDILWSHEASIEKASMATGVSISSNGEFLVVPYTSGDVVCLNRYGKMLWSEHLGASNAAQLSFKHVATKPIIEGRDVFVGAISEHFAKFDLKTGDKAWDIPKSAFGIPASSGNAIFFTTLSKTLVAASKKTGDIFWETSLPHANDELFGKSIHWTAPVLSGNRIYVVGSNNEIRVLDAKTGELIQSIKINRPVLTQPIILDNTLVLMTQTGQVLFYR